MKKASVLLLSICLLLGLSPVTAAADRDRPAAVHPDPDSTLPVSYITHPCILYSVSPPETGPMVASCLSPLNTSAWIGLPLPQLVDREPDYSLVSIPTFFSVGWDGTSLGYGDSQGKDIAWPVGNATNRLENVRLQLRLTVLEQGGRGDLPLGQMGMWTEQPRQVRLYAMTGKGKWGLSGPDVDLACNPGIVGAEGADPQVNSLFMVPWLWGGFNKSLPVPSVEEGSEQNEVPEEPPEPAGDPCAYLGSRLHSAVDLLTAGQDGNAPRYLDMFGVPLTLRDQAFVVWTPYLTEVELEVRTTVALEARMIWTDHLVKTTTRTLDCRWEYRDRYDIKDWSRWPDPIYCREVVRETWLTVCRPEGDDCESELYSMGDSEAWWQPVAEMEGQGIRLTDGTYAQLFSFPVHEVAAFLTAP